MNFYLLIFVFLCSFCIQAGAQAIGVNYGLLGDNLPPPSSVVQLLKTRNINIVRVFDPNHDVLSALVDSNIEVVIGVRNEDLKNLAGDPSFAAQWVETNVMTYFPGIRIRYIVAGNEVIPGPVAQFLFGAMMNLDSALKAAYIHIPVTTAIHFAVIGQGNLPSQGTLTEEAGRVLAPIVEFLKHNQYPLLANLYTYFAYISYPEALNLDFALGKPGGGVISDSPLQYNNLFDAIVDTIYSALEKIGGESIRIVVSETGWPSAGYGDIATVANAQAYNDNLIAAKKSTLGTPKRPEIAPETYIFSLFNENLKPPGTEQNFGLYHPDMTQVYHVGF